MCEAKKCLLESGRTLGSPQLNSFGPTMVLAKELLEQGERDAVLEYLHLCPKFWKSETAESRLDQWSQAIKEGMVPDFGRAGER